MGREDIWKQIRPALLVAALVLAGCSDDALSGAPETDYCPENIGLTVSPYAVTRGATIEIVVIWETTEPLSSPVATLSVGVANAVEVDVPLVLAPDLESGSVSGGDRYLGSLLNPFGLGAPSGAGRVLAIADTIGDCLSSPSATTTFELQ